MMLLFSFLLLLLTLSLWLSLFVVGVVAVVVVGIVVVVSVVVVVVVVNVYVVVAAVVIVDVAVVVVVVAQWLVMISLCCWRYCCCKLCGSCHRRSLTFHSRYMLTELVLIVVFCDAGQVDEADEVGVCAGRSAGDKASEAMQQKTASRAACTASSGGRRR